VAQVLIELNNIISYQKQEFQRRRFAIVIFLGTRPFAGWGVVARRQQSAFVVRHLGAAARGPRLPPRGAVSRRPRFVFAA
jgi:hypothetical protein